MRTSASEQDLPGFSHRDYASLAPVFQWFKSRYGGRQWQNSTGDEFRYYMVFQNNDPYLEGAYEFGEFIELAERL